MDDSLKLFSGDPFSVPLKYPPAAPKVTKEIEWGLLYRGEPKDIFPKQTFPSSPPKDKRQPIKKFTVWRPPKIPRISQLKKIISRDALTTKQYVNMLSTPKEFTFVPHEKIPVIAQFRPTTPRTLQLAIPRKQNILCTWQTYQHSLPPEKIECLKDMFNTATNMEINDAQQCFEAMNREQKLKQQKLKKKELLSKKRERKWILSFAGQAAEIIGKFIYNENLYHLNHNQKAFSDMIMKQLYLSRKIKRLSRNSTSLYKQFLVEISDQCAVFIDTVLKNSEMRDKSMGTSSVESLTDSHMSSDLSESGEQSAEDTSSIEEDFDQEKAKQKLNMSKSNASPDKLLDSESAQLLDMESYLQKLIRILSSHSDETKLKPVFSDCRLPNVILKEIIEDIKPLQIKSLEVPETFSIQPQFNEKLTERLIEKEKDVMDETMQKVVDYVAHELALKYGRNLLLTDCYDMPEDEDEVARKKREQEENENLLAEELLNQKNNLQLEGEPEDVDLDLQEKKDKSSESEIDLSPKEEQDDEEMKRKAELERLRKLEELRKKAKQKCNCKQIKKESEAKM